MPLSVVCPHCAATVLVPDQDAGRSASCQGCGAEFSVPEVAHFTCAACGRNLEEGRYNTDPAGDNLCLDCWEAGVAAPPAGGTGELAAAVGGLIDLPCPQCGRNLSVASEYAGTTIRCPYPDCGAEAMVPLTAHVADYAQGPISYQTPARYQRYPHPPHVPNHLTKAILVTLFCCWPAGIVAIVYAAQVNSKLRAGDVRGAAAASGSADTWATAAIFLGLAAAGLQALVMVLGGR